MRITWLFAALVLGGCSASPDMAANEETWKQYGYDQSVVGLYPMSSEQISTLSEANKAAYKEGYNIGRTDYCSYAPVVKRKYMNDHYGRICSQYQKL
ncbi:DUF2799 domain-containing protein [Vibrio sp. SCSIO 43140]|uniref:DUF2799 domain-containing protein n=1 Tax=Vibrio sp. SCSIO 43140 TaxID=2819100 RepID=UPI0020750930|nr:DUF2799 domain-containing protein [Vibrio sp. SCSIO 43140]USD62489.1 DUF2799 domain-containing protein [Vibrio sp. SCSIO 43140]